MPRSDCVLGYCKPPTTGDFQDVCCLSPSSRSARHANSESSNWAKGTYLGVDSWPIMCMLPSDSTICASAEFMTLPIGKLMSAVLLLAGLLPKAPLLQRFTNISGTRFARSTAPSAPARTLGPIRLSCPDILGNSILPAQDGSSPGNVRKSLLESLFR